MPSAAPPRTAPHSSPAGTREVFHALGELFALMRQRIRETMRRYDLPPAYAMALAQMDDVVSMKELGARLRCDPSFLTAIAGALEERGLARRETDRADRRGKNLVLTRRGVAARATLKKRFFDDPPGIRMLGAGERSQLLSLLRKMVAAEAESSSGRARPQKPRR